MPRSPWSDRMYRELEEIYTKRGLIPIVAHVDRYIGPFQTFGIPERLAEMPVIVQANAEFFLRKATSRMALRLLRKNQIQLLGSDCHNLTSRAPNLGEAIRVIEKGSGQKAIERINQCVEDILNSENIDQKAKFCGNSEI